jgi:hypothetical protein
MSNNTRNRLNKIADILQSFADGIVAGLEIVLGDHGGKRPRRSRRTITRVPRKSTVRPIIYRIYNQRVIVKKEAA